LESDGGRPIASMCHGVPAQNRSRGPHTLLLEVHPGFRGRNRSSLGQGGVALLPAEP
jgi:hypothetical protein